jgi:tRNA threonylcarbamoyladenosine biosynthesis protein TsaE
MDVTLDELDTFARQFVDALPSGEGTRAHVVGLAGELGSGKTTFVQAVARAMGVKEQLTSPTFVLAQRYHTNHPVFSHLVHIDAYRLSRDEPDTIGFQEYLNDPSTLILVEWPENMPYAAHFPEEAPVMRFETVDEKTRRISNHG